MQTPLANKLSQTTGKGYERATAIVRAARAMLAAEGFAALSMRSVALAAGCGLSTLQHYYPSKGDLMEAVLKATFDDYQAAIEGILAQAPTAPRERFLATIDYFLEDLQAPAASGPLLEIAALATRDSFAAQVYEQMMTRARKTMRKLIGEMVPGLTPEERDTRAVLVVAQLHGMMVFHKPELTRAARAAILAIAEGA